MIEVRYKLSNARLALGGVIIAIGAGLFTFGATFGLGWLSLLGGALFAIGVLVTLTGCFKVYRSCKLIPQWYGKLLEQALRSAPASSTIRILQTWLPDREGFCPLLEELLIEGKKQFRLEVLLMNSVKADTDFDDLLATRVRLRAETRDQAHREIVATVQRLFEMKKRVDSSWEDVHLGARLALEIRCYEFMPFGPIYQIGQTHLFIGFYINYESSIKAPMIVAYSPKSKIWDVFERDFREGWKKAEGKKVIGVDLNNCQLIFGENDGKIQVS